MSDLPLSDPFDEHASELLDTGANAPADDVALGARLAELRDLRAALADVPPPDAARREQAVAAALAAFSLADDVGREAPATAPAPVVRLPARGAAPTRWLTLAAAAVVGVALVAGGVLASRRSSGGEKSSATGGAYASDTGAKAVATEASRTAAASAASATTAAASATPAASAVALPPTPTTIAPAPANTAVAGGTPPSTPAVTPPPSVTLPYIGDVGSVAELDAYGARLASTNTTVAGSEAPGQGGGATVRKALADTACPVDALGVPVALMRWQGRAAVLVSDNVTLRVIGLGDCAVLVARPLGG